MVPDWAAGEPVMRRAFICGSRARGNHLRDSDVIGHDKARKEMLWISGWSTRESMTGPYG